MTAEQLILQYGYWALFIGTFLEGETILIVAGLLAHRGYLELHWVILAAFLGTFAGDQTFFHIGRTQGIRFLDRRPSWRDKTRRVFSLLHRHQVAIILGFRFVYGVRNVTPFVIGASNLNPLRFFLLNFVGALTWAIAFGVIGYQLGSLMEPMLERAKDSELLILGLVLTIGFLIYLRSKAPNGQAASGDAVTLPQAASAPKKPFFLFSPSGRILIGALLGVALGLWLQSHPKPAPTVLAGCDLVGGAFIDLLKMVLLPLVFTSIAVGIAQLQAHESMHRVWRWTVVYFLTATTLATLLGLFTANYFKPGAGLSLDLFKNSMTGMDTQRLSLAEFATQFIRHLFMNPVAAMAQGQIVPTVAFAILVGIAFVVSGERSRHLQALVREALELIMRIVGWIMVLAPVGILALIARLVATQDLALFTSLGKFIAVVIGGTLFHGVVTLPLLLYLTARVGPIRFFQGAWDALVTAFATCSSSATLPVTQRCTEDNLGVDKSIAGFVPPLGATLNMDGTALYEAAAALFVANLTGADLNLVQQLVVCLTAIVASIGAPGIPSAGMVTMVMVLQSVGLPAEAIAILLPIDRLLDTVRTAVNVEGDMIGSLIVQKMTAEPQKPDA